MIKIDYAPVYAPLWNTDKNFIILQGGRDSGKTITARDYLMYRNNVSHETDMIVARDSYGSLADSLYATMTEFITKHNLWQFYRVRKNPLRIVNIKSKSNIYFCGIGGSDIDRTKGIKTEHEVSVVIFEELQQTKEQANYEQAIASFRRLLTDNAKVIHIFNPPQLKANWINVWARLKESDSDYLVIKSTWLDVIHYLKDIDIKEILKMQRLDKDTYDWMYMGLSVGGLGSVYPQFKPDKHLISYAQAQEKFRNEKIIGIIIGGDNAITHDGTCLCPIAIFTNGQCAVLDLFYHNPQTDGDMAVSEMIPYIQKWLKELEKKYGLNNSGYYGQFTPITFIIDGSMVGIELVKELRFVLNPQRYDVLAYTNKNVLQMTGNMKSVFARNMLYIIDYGGRKNYVKDRWEKGYNILAEQIENLLWNEKGTGYDPIVPNDCADALTYGANAIFKNMFNLYYVDKAIKIRKDFYDLGGADL